MIRRQDDSAAALSEDDHLASIRYRGIEGMFSLRVEAEIYQNQSDSSTTTPQTDGNDEKDNGEGDVPPNKKPKQFISITREGIGRRYRVEILAPALSPRPKTFYWKGSKAALSMVEDQAHHGNGNLKLIAAGDPAEVLAVWQNRTDKEILGCLSIFARFEEGEGGLLEEVVVSCLAVVLAERTSGRGMVGGLFK